MAFSGDLHLTNTQTGFIFSAFAYPYLFSELAAGMAGRLHWRSVDTHDISSRMGSATVLTGIAGSIKTMVGARFLLGVGEAATFPAATRAMLRWTSERKRGFAQGIAHAVARGWGMP